MIDSISHITLIVRDLERTADLLKYVFHAEEVYSSGDRTFSRSREKFFLIGSIWLCIMEGESLNERTYNHVAFHIGEGEFDEILSRVHGMGLDMLPDRDRIHGEGRSIYFYDFDNHLFELHTGTLETRLAEYRDYDGRGE